MPRLTSLSGKILSPLGSVIDIDYRILQNPNAYSTSDSDEFGNSVSIDGNNAIVSAFREDDAGGTQSGKAYIFNVTTMALVHTLDNPNAYSTSAGDQFGNSVAISGDRAIVGADTEDDAGGSSSGKAYIFNVTSGALVHTLDNPNPGFNFGYGNSVAIDGNSAIVGCPGDDTPLASSGIAYIYNVTSGALVHTLNNPNDYDTAQVDFFGDSVAISGNSAIVGAPFEDDAGGTTSGKAYIFNVTSGALVHTLDNPNAYSTSAGDQFGRAVAISGNSAIVGAFNEDDASGTQSGKAYIFNVTSGALVHTLDNPNPVGTSANDSFGRHLSISGNYAIVSAYGEDRGKAYIFNVTTGTLVRTLDNPGADYRYGEAVSITSDWAIVGNYWAEDQDGGYMSGKAYVYDITEL